MLPLWHFKQDEYQRWRWTRVGSDNVTSESSESFVDRIACVMDAVLRHAVRRRRTHEVGFENRRL
jgi:hypothetical protein